MILHQLHIHPGWYFAEVSTTVKQFMISVNQQFPGGTLLSDHDFKKLLMDLSSEMLESSSARQKHAVRIVGRNQLGDDDPLLEEIQISCTGSVAVGNESL